MLHKIAKIFHLCGLVLWLGPSTGGYVLLAFARAQQRGYIAYWLFYEYVKLVDAEAAGLILLVASGLTMLLSTPALRKARWLRYKLSIVFPVFIPLELLQLYIFHRVVSGAYASGTGMTAAVALFDRFTLVSIMILFVTVPAVLILAVLKPFGETRLKALIRNGPFVIMVFRLTINYF